MKVTVIYGAMHKGSTYNCVQELLKNFTDVEVTEFFLPKDMPHFCNGCFSCFLKGENTCPHYNQVNNIKQSMLKANLIILASPVYVCDVSGQMKALLDHFGYIWMPHRPEYLMFNKIGLVLSTAAGAGTSHTNKTMKKSLNYWGLKRVFSYKKNVGAMSWEEVNSKNKNQIIKEFRILADKISKAVAKSNTLKPRLFTKIIFTAMKGMQKKNSWNETDKNYWKEQGWLEGKKPW